MKRNHPIQTSSQSHESKLQQSKSAPAQKKNTTGKWKYSSINLSELPTDKKILVYSGKCHCSKCARKFSQDTIYNCTAMVRTAIGKSVPVTVQYCSGCGTFYMNYDVYRSYSKKYGGLLFGGSIDGNGIEIENRMGLADDSFLSRAGYSVNANMPRQRRQGILAGLMDDGKATKWEITEKISEFIRLGKKNPNMQDAIKRWEEDIAFVADYDADNQTKVGRASFKRGGKITRR